LAITDSLGLAAAEQLERSVGPFIALPAFKKLFVRGGEAAFNARVLLGALRCAAKLGDEQEVEALASLWDALGQGGEHLPAITVICRMLDAAGQRWSAATLAGAEAARKPQARAFYLWARCLERAGDRDGAHVAFGRAAEMADKEPAAADVALAARARRIERMLGDPTLSPLALADATSADPTAATPAQKMVIALARLSAPSRFVRASGLSLLEELARDPLAPLAPAAIRAAAEHADAMGDALTPLEADRVAATLGHWLDEATRKRALARLEAAQKIAAARGQAQEEAILSASNAVPEIYALVCRARAVLTGGGQGTYAPHPAAGDAPPSPSLRLASLGLDAVVALGRGKPREVAAALRDAASYVRPGTAVPPPLWTACRMALEANEPAPREAGVLLAQVLLDTATSPPPRGYLVLSHALRRAGRGDLAVRAAQVAENQREPGAREELGAMLRDEGWRLAAQGDREAAIAMLRRAKERLVAPKKGAS
jgi:tetratricopeptide (TPR) repeat protein